MTILLDGLYRCSITGQNVRVLNGMVECHEIINDSDCERAQKNMIGCSVYVDVSRAYAQSQPKCTEERRAW